MKLGLDLEELNDVERMAVNEKIAEFDEKNATAKWQSLIDAYFWAIDQNLAVKMFAGGTKSDFEIFTSGFSPEKREKTRKVWSFTQ